MPTIHSISDALLQLVNEVFLFLPKLVGALIWLLIGYIVARILKAALTRGLRAVKFDQFARRAGVEQAIEAMGPKLDAAALLAGIVYWYVFLYFVVLAVSALGITTITTFVNGILLYLPNVFVAILIVMVGAFAATLGADLVKGAARGMGTATAGVLATVVRYAILTFAVVAALTQLQIAPALIYILFAAIMGALALAGGLAFGLGGVDSARSLLASRANSSLLQPGQQVQIGQQQGTVIRHDMNVTVLDTGSGQVSIPNATLTKDHVTVMSGNGRG